MVPLAVKQMDLVPRPPRRQQAVLREVVVRPFPKEDVPDQLVLVTGGLLFALVDWSVQADVEQANEGSELLDLN